MAWLSGSVGCCHMKTSLSAHNLVLHYPASQLFTEDTMLPIHNQLILKNSLRCIESACNVGDLGSILELGRSPGGENGNLRRYSCLENPHGQRSLREYSPWGRKESDMTEQLHFHFFFAKSELRIFLFHHLDPSSECTIIYLSFPPIH